MFNDTCLYSLFALYVISIVNLLFDFKLNYKNKLINSQRWIILTEGHF